MYDRSGPRLAAKKRLPVLQTDPTQIRAQDRQRLVDLSREKSRDTLWELRASA